MAPKDGKLSARDKKRSKAEKKKQAREEKKKTPKGSPAVSPKATPKAASSARVPREDHLRFERFESLPPLSGSGYPAEELDGGKLLATLERLTLDNDKKGTEDSACETNCDGPMWMKATVDGESKPSSVITSKDAPAGLDA